MNYLNYSEDSLNEMGAYWTAREIQQQPNTWLKTLSYLQSKQASIDAFLTPILATKNLRVILTGAGTSAFIGNSIAPALSANLGFQVEAIATTDLVSNPRDFLREGTPTLLVSFARSGNSPESVAAVEYAQKLIPDCYQLAITCNANGELFNRCQQAERSMALLMPKETNDKSLAMTSSFSSMLLTGLYLFSNKTDFQQQLESASATTSTFIAKHHATLKKIAEKRFERAVYLGSGVFKGLAQESALKLLELTDGKVLSAHDSPLGFRHGPKAIVNEDTLVVVFISNDPHTRKYDLSLVKEIYNDGHVGEVVTVASMDILELSPVNSLVLEGMESASDIFLLLPYIVCAQIYAFEHSLKVGNSPDNPSSSGAINRVVKGVSIHSL